MRAVALVRTVIDRHRVDQPRFHVTEIDPVGSDVGEQGQGDPERSFGYDGIRVEFDYEAVAFGIPSGRFLAAQDCCHEVSGTRIGRLESWRRWAVTTSIVCCRIQPRNCSSDVVRPRPSDVSS